MFEPNAVHFPATVAIENSKIEGSTSGTNSSLIENSILSSSNIEVQVPVAAANNPQHQQQQPDDRNKSRSISSDGGNGTISNYTNNNNVGVIKTKLGTVRPTDNPKRVLPAYKKSNAALTFPEKMMNLMNHATDEGRKLRNSSSTTTKHNGTKESFCVSWLPDGKAFVIYDIKKFTKGVVPKFFKASKFSSFTRKLYRWGFRQLNRGIGPDEPVVFGNEFFQHDKPELMVNMRSITAATIRKRESDLLQQMLLSKHHQQQQAKAMFSQPPASSSLYGCGVGGMGMGVGVGGNNMMNSVAAAAATRVSASMAGMIAAANTATRKNQRQYQDFLAKEYEMKRQHQHKQDMFLGVNNTAGGLLSTNTKTPAPASTMAASAAAMNRIMAPPSLTGAAGGSNNRYGTPGLSTGGVGTLIGLGLGDQQHQDNTNGGRTGANTTRLSHMSNNELQDLYLACAGAAPSSKSAPASAITGGGGLAGMVPVSSSSSEPPNKKTYFLKNNRSMNAISNPINRSMFEMNSEIKNLNTIAGNVGYNNTTGNSNGNNLAIMNQNQALTSFNNHSNNPSTTSSSFAFNRGGNSNANVNNANMLSASELALMYGRNTNGNNPVNTSGSGMFNNSNDYGVNFQQQQQQLHAAAAAMNNNGGAATGSMNNVNVMQNNQNYNANFGNSSNSIGSLDVTTLKSNIQHEQHQRQRQQQQNQASLMMGVESPDDLAMWLRLQQQQQQQQQF